MRDKRYEHGGNIYDYDRGLIDFSSNINPLGPPTWLREIIDKVDLSTYPDIHYRELRESIGRYVNYPMEYIIPGNGLIELIFLFVRAFRIRKPLIVSPTFMEYERAVLLNGGKPRFLRLRDDDSFKVNIYEVMNRIPDVDGIFICNPNNPTGTALRVDELRAIIETAKLFNIPVFVDEAFIEFMLDEKDHSALSLVDNFENLIVARAITKFFALPGIRLGYIVSQPSVIEKLWHYKEPWSVNSIAVEIGKHIFEDKDYIEKSKETISNLREEFIRELSKIDKIEVFPSTCNFILLKLKKLNSAILKTKLIERGFLIRDASTFRYLNKKFIRLAVRKKEENIKLVETLSQILREG